MSGPRRPAAPRALLGTLALVALVEVTLGRFERDVLPPLYWDWRGTGRAAGAEAAGAEVLCFGDSLVKLGVLPTVLERRTARRAYNLAPGGGTPVASYLLLRRALGAGARPAAVVVDAAPFLLAKGPRAPNGLRCLPEILTPAELLDVAWSARDPDLFARLALARLLPSFRARDDLRAAALALARRRRPTLRVESDALVRNMERNHGASALQVKPPTEAEVVLSAAEYLSRFDCDPLNAAYLDRFLDLTAARGIPTFWLLPPPLDAAQRHAERSGFDAAHTAFVRALQARHPGLTVLDARRSGYDRGLYVWDVLHLNRLGAVAFSDDVAAVLHRALTGVPVAPWVTLPPYRPRAIAVEDTAASALAVRARGAVRR